jgi:hypothetical protein
LATGERRLALMLRLANLAFMPDREPNDGLDRVRHQLRASGVRDEAPDPLLTGIHTRSGRFWEPESYDHWIRNDEEKARIRRCIRNNPVTAGLCRAAAEWRWSSAWPEWASRGGLPARDTAD